MLGVSSWSTDQQIVKQNRLTPISVVIVILIIVIIIIFTSSSISRKSSAIVMMMVMKMMKYLLAEGTAQVCHVEGETVAVETSRLLFLLHGAGHPVRQRGSLLHHHCLPPLARGENRCRLLQPLDEPMGTASCRQNGGAKCQSMTELG